MINIILKWPVFSSRNVGDIFLFQAGTGSNFQILNQHNGVEEWSYL